MLEVALIEKAQNEAAAVAYPVDGLALEIEEKDVEYEAATEEVALVELVEGAFPPGGHQDKAAAEQKEALKKLTLEKEIADLKACIQEEENKISQVRERISVIEFRMERQIAAQENLSSEIHTLKAEIENLKKEEKQHLQKIRSVAEAILGLEEQLAQIELQIAQYHTASEARRATLKNIQDQKIALEREIDAFDITLQTLQARYDVVEAEDKKHTQEREILEAERNKNKEKISAPVVTSESRLRKEQAYVQRKNEELQKEFIQLYAEYRQDQASHTAEVKEEEKNALGCSARFFSQPTKPAKTQQESFLSSYTPPLIPTAISVICFFTGPIIDINSVEGRILKRDKIMLHMLSTFFMLIDLVNQFLPTSRFFSHYLPVQEENAAPRTLMSICQKKGYGIHFDQFMEMSADLGLLTALFLHNIFETYILDAPISPNSCLEMQINQLRVKLCFLTLYCNAVYTLYFTSPSTHPEPVALQEDMRTESTSSIRPQ